MNFFQHPSYKLFSGAIKGVLGKKANLFLVSVPGMSVTFYIKKFLEKEGGKDYKYIQRGDEPLSKLNILDLDFDRNENALIIAEEYFKKAGLGQKFVLVVNTPYVLEIESFQRSFVGSHTYNSYYFKTLDIELIKIFASILNVSVSQRELKKVYDLSGGLTRMVKFLLTHKEILDDSISKILESADFKRVFLSTARVIARCNKETLLKLGIMEVEDFKGGILKAYFRNNPLRPQIDIKINPDLTFTEDSGVGGKRLLKSERLILEDMVKNEGVIAKEKVADFKWGEGSYDQYSDQAIAKTIMRLKSKLKKYTIIALPGFGYKIQARS